MSTVHIVVTDCHRHERPLGAAAIARFKPSVSAMAQVNVPESWLIFPIGTLKNRGRGRAASRPRPVLHLRRLHARTRT